VVGTGRQRPKEKSRHQKEPSGRTHRHCYTTSIKFKSCATTRSISNTNDEFAIRIHALFDWLIFHWGYLQKKVAATQVNHVGQGIGYFGESPCSFQTHAISQPAWSEYQIHAKEEYNAGGNRVGKNVDSQDLPIAVSLQRVHLLVAARSECIINTMQQLLVLLMHNTYLFHYHPLGGSTSIQFGLNFCRHFFACGYDF
jgi:hypothetical protein